MGWITFEAFLSQETKPRTNSLLVWHILGLIALQWFPWAADFTAAQPSLGGMCTLLENYQEKQLSFIDSQFCPAKLQCRTSTSFRLVSLVPVYDSQQSPWGPNSLAGGKECLLQQPGKACMAAARDTSPRALSLAPLASTARKLPPHEANIISELAETTNSTPLFTYI